MSNRNNLIYHQNHIANLTNPSEIIGSNLNTLSRRIIKKSININSMFREVYAPSNCLQNKCSNKDNHVQNGTQKCAKKCDLGNQVLEHRHKGNY